MDNRSFLIERSLMADLIYNRDWSKSSLGSTAFWTREFKTTLNIMLACPTPVAVFWGPQYLMFYNDAYIPIANGKHPTCVGEPAQKIWEESWDALGNNFRDVYYSGKNVYEEDVLIPVKNRQGELIDKYWVYTLFPVFEDNRITGVFNTVRELIKK